MATFHSLFSNPSAEYRGKPFWSWNGKLNADELRRQLRIFQQMGMGGAFLHSRVGLVTPYLSKEWMDLTEDAVNECRRLGMEAWLYDEDRWPSGSAGGLVTKNPKYRMHFLTLEIVSAQSFLNSRSSARNAGTILGIWEARVDGYNAGDVTYLGKNPKHVQPSQTEGRSVLVIRDMLQPNSDWYNGYSYLDTMSPIAVGAFIKSTHEQYRKRFGHQFGKSIHGIFTDEPNYGVSCQYPPVYGTDSQTASTNWTPKLPVIFRKRYGYDLKPWLPALFLNLDDPQAQRARWHYRDCLTHLFVTNFAQQIGEWCAKHKLPFTGHILLEGDLRSQTSVVGACMPFYEHMQAPGIDILTEHNHEYDTAKQTASVLHQTGRKWLLSELYGCTGWDFPLEGHKAVGDWQTALGVNLRCHHLSWYTMKGEAKRDYPASIFFQSPWWEHYSALEDYYSRLHVALTQGEPSRRVLVIHPVESMWLKYLNYVNAADQPEQVFWQETREEFNSLSALLPKLRDMLLQGHIDFDYGDETMLPRLASVKRAGKAALLRVGKASYDAVVVPPQLTIRAGTLKLLKKFAAGGGRVLFVGEPPALVDALASPAAAELAAATQQVAFESEPLLAALATQREVSICDADGHEIPTALYMLRRDGHDAWLFICNTDRTRGYDHVTVRIKTGGKAAELLPATGGAWKVEPAKDGAWLTLATDLPATGSRLFAFGKPARPALARPQFAALRTVPLGEPRACQLSEPNVFVLDNAQYKLGRDKQWTAPLEILQLDMAVRKTLGLNQRSGNMKQPWARDHYGHEPATPLQLRYTFNIDALPRSAPVLAHEMPAEAHLTLNGHPVSQDLTDGWWVDPCLRRLPLPAAALRIGENVLEVCLDFRDSADLEAMFLLGDFGVQVAGARASITAPPAALAHGDWTAQALPFYGGAVAYRYALPERPAPGERLVLQLGAWHGALVRVLVNGQVAGFLGWPPYELDLTPALAAIPADAPLELTIELFGSRRNCFGPLHHTDLHPRAIGPGSFKPTPGAWTDDYMLKPVGLLTAPSLRVEQQA